MCTGRSKWLTAMMSVTGLVAMLGTARAAPPAQSCQSAKNKAVGKYSDCRHKGEAKFALTADALKRTADLAKCLLKYQRTWPVLEARAVAQGGAGPSVGDQVAVQTEVDVYSGNIVTELAGGEIGRAHV